MKEDIRFVNDTANRPAGTSGRGSERIIIMGPHGSGKSHLARKLGAARGLPVFHLDQISWMPGWRLRPVAERQAAVARIVAAPAWIIDGNDHVALACRMRHADVLVYLDVPRYLTLPRILWRMLTGLGRMRPDMAAGCQGRFDVGVLRAALRWTPRRRARNRAQLRTFPGLTIVLASHRDRKLFEARYMRRQSENGSWRRR